MLRTFALLLAVLSTPSLAQELTPPPPPPPSMPDPSELEPRARPLRPLSPRDLDRFHVPRGPIPEGYHLVEEPRWGLVAGGSAAFVGSTVIMVLIALATRNPVLGIPVVGQVAALGEVMQSSSGYAVFFGGLGLIIDVAAQIAGITMVIVGLANPTRWLERDATAPRVMFVPAAAGAPLGASLVGRF